jgi:2,3,4,5-tetrahydropyridine-2-carboxylate N-succinyltransferase
MLQTQVKYMSNTIQLLQDAYENRELLAEEQYKQAVLETMEGLDKGTVRIAEPTGDDWKVNDWAKKAVLMYFSLTEMETLKAGPMQYHDKIPLKTEYQLQGVRVVPPAVARYGSHLEPGVIMMPSYVNIGAYVGTGTMVDTWATVGSCAQIGTNVHLSGGVGIGGVLEPPQGKPVIIEDGAFLGSRAIVVEGVHVKKRAVLGAGVVLTKSTKIIDVSGSEEVIYNGEVPENAVVIPGTRMKKFPAGEYGTPCALIIGRRSASTDEKTSLNQALREFEVPV